MNRYLSFIYWFGFNPDSLSHRTTVLLLVVFGLMLAVGLGMRVSAFYWKPKMDKPGRKLMRKIYTLVFAMGILGLLWLVFAFEGIPLFSAKFWLLAWLAGSVYWMITVIKYWKTTLPALRQQEAERLRKQQYS